MALEELSSGDEDVLPQLQEALQNFTSLRDEIDAEMSTRFSEWDASHDRSVLTAIRSLLNRRKYITNLIAQANEATANVSDRV